MNRLSTLLNHLQPSEVNVNSQQQQPHQLSSLNLAASSSSNDQSFSLTDGEDRVIIVTGIVYSNERNKQAHFAAALASSVPHAFRF
jgi:hypothetical protein